MPSRHRGFDYGIPIDPDATLSWLPPHLRGRVWRPATNAGAGGPWDGGDCVLYWMRMAVRGHENPALDVALHLGARLGKPVLVYHAVSERYPFASDRHHAFILQGAMDVAEELAARGIPYRLHVERSGQTPGSASVRGAGDPPAPVLKQLAGRCAAVVTERVPVPPFDGCGGSGAGHGGWTPSLAAHLAGLSDPVPLWEVDTNCVVPMPEVDRTPRRAFEFRDRYASLRDEHLGVRWDSLQAPEPVVGALPELGFEPVEPAGMCIPELLAQCSIDHAVPPVAHMPGGSKAGYARWREFCNRRLRAYAKRRNNAEDRDGVSRMSAYLHYGHVSPFRLVRDALSVGGPGADKWLDELLIWRELAWAWAHKLAAEGVDLHSPAALPAWAVESLAACGRDPRPALFDGVTLSRSQSGDPLWDACQDSLRIHGELHNNLRMTWGKAILDWTPDAEGARELLVDLNHRYALDGRDPASYGGLYWCLGLFDKQFKPTQPITGALRTRPTRVHRKRLDLDQYRRSIATMPGGRPMRVAVIGAGIAGLAAAGTLQDQGHRVVVFEKSRGVGGRMSTRRSRSDSGRGLTHDHGAQYFTARDPRFRRQVASWVESGVAAPWEGRLITLEKGADGSVVAGDDPNPGVRYVGTPGMNSVQKHLARGLEVRTGVRVQELQPQGRRWSLLLNANEVADGFDAVLVCIPAEQAAVLLAPAERLAHAAGSVRTGPCFAAMLTFPQPLDVPFSGAFVRGGPLSWIAEDTSKPGRDAGQGWVLHGSPEWSQKHLEEDPQTLLPEMVAAFGDLVRGWQPQLSPTEFAVAHRWRYALPENPLAVDHLWDGEQMLGAAGDWCGGPRVEGAWQSGVALAGALLRQLALAPQASLSAPQ